MKWRKDKTPAPEAPFPGEPAAVDGSEAIVFMETAASDAAGAYPITPATQMGEGWALAVAAGKRNVFGRKLVFFEPEGEHAAAGVTAGMSLMGLRATNFSAGQGIGNKESVDLIYQLAALFGKSAVAGSRIVCDLSWLEYRCQVGVSGATVSPQLYIACGISGALQHVVGMRDSEYIVAINKDPAAAIFQIADV